MLGLELSGTPYSKAEHRRRLVTKLNKRSEPSVEFKHANISAVLIELGFPYISGYKPRSNYQSLLFEVVSDRLRSSRDLEKLVAIDVERPVKVPDVDDILRAWTDPPVPNDEPKRLAQPRATYAPAPINYLEREARNRNLGLAGEEFVINFERARLIQLNRENLASKIEHVSKLRGDAEGFDVLSFEADGRRRLIEVKTTKYGPHTPFFVSRNEVNVSEASANEYHLFRVFEFRQIPRLFGLQGALSSTCRLAASTYVATAGKATGGSKAQ